MCGRIVAYNTRLSCGDAYYNWHERKQQSHEEPLVPCGLRPRAVRLLSVHSGQLSDETIELAKALLYNCVVVLTELRLRQMPCGARIPVSGEAPILLSHAPAQLPCVVVSSLNMPLCCAAEFL